QKLLWLRTGTADFLVTRTRETVDLLKRHGFNPVYKESTGGHTWTNWRNYLNEFAPQLFQEAGHAVMAAAAERAFAEAPGRRSESVSPLSPAPKGFDARRDGIERGRVETVEYDSKSVGARRRMVVYTPPGYSKDAKF